MSNAITVPEYKLRVMQLKAKLCQDLLDLLDQGLDYKEFQKQAILLKTKFEYDTTHQYHEKPRRSDETIRS